VGRISGLEPTATRLGSRAARPTSAGANGTDTTTGVAVGPDSTRSRGTVAGRPPWRSSGWWWLVGVGAMVVGAATKPAPPQLQLKVSHMFFWKNSCLAFFLLFSILLFNHMIIAKSVAKGPKFC
jgi:hypothetical protein